MYIADGRHMEGQFLRKVEELRSLDATIDEDVELLRRMLEN